MVSISTPQYFTPEALAMVQGIYNEITQMPWFPHHATDRRQFAIDIIAFYENGLTEPHLLRQTSIAHAIKHYSPSRRAEGGSRSEGPTAVFYLVPTSSPPLDETHPATTTETAPLPEPPPAAETAPTAPEPTAPDPTTPTTPAPAQ